MAEARQADSALVLQACRFARGRACRAKLRQEVKLGMAEHVS